MLRRRGLGWGRERKLCARFALSPTQVDEAEAREETLDLAKKAKRPPTPSSGLGRKRFRFNSESG